MRGEVEERQGRGKAGKDRQDLDVMVKVLPVAFASVRRDYPFSPPPAKQPALPVHSCQAFFSSWRSIPFLFW
jgi:hypothetical protein